ncbi:MAG: hypothetical protein ACK455_04020, partial [Bacteroidota bacterium]
MRHETTIFDGAIFNENSFTELFKNFLRFALFRQGFIDLIEFDFDKDKIDFDCFDTQYTISKFGRPDLALFTERTEILFEIKVYNTGLTKNQPTGYYTHLKSKTDILNKALILIIPENYYDIKTYNKLLDELKSSKDGIHTQIIYWEQISKIITDIELELVSPLFYEYSKFLSHWFQLNSIYLDSLNTSTMFDKKFPESLEKTMIIVSNLCDELLKRNLPVRRSTDRHFNEYGFYVDLLNEETIFFGIWFDYWKETGKPVCICIDSKSSKQISAFTNGVKKGGLTPAKEFEEYLT